MGSPFPTPLFTSNFLISFLFYFFPYHIILHIFSFFTSRFLLNRHEQKFVDLVEIRCIKKMSYPDLQGQGHQPRVHIHQIQFPLLGLPVKTKKHSEKWKGLEKAENCNFKRRQVVIGDLRNGDLDQHVISAARRNASMQAWDTFRFKKRKNTLLGNLRSLQGSCW